MFERLSSPKLVEIEMSDLLDLAFTITIFKNLDILDVLVDILPTISQTDFNNYFIERPLIIENQRTPMEDYMDILKYHLKKVDKWKNE